MAQEVACSFELPDQPLDCAISSSAPLVATGLVTGEVFVYRYKHQQGGSGASSSGRSSTYAAQLAFRRPSKKKGPKGSCRAVAFSADGSSLLGGFEDGSLLQLDAATGKLQRKLPAAHPAAVSRLLPLDGTAAAAGTTLAAAGDEQGRVQVWDMRTKQAAMTYTDHTEYISDMALHTADEGCLVAVSGDGTLSVHELRKGGAGGGGCIARSEDDADDELLSVVVLKNGKKLAVGTQSGVLSLYSWGYFADCSDRFPGHPESVDALVKFDEDTVITGSSDGVLRIVSVLPNKLLGVAGQHEELPIERLALSGDRRLLASASHDNSVKLWDLSYMHGDGDGDDDADDEDAGGSQEEAAAAAGEEPAAAGTSGAQRQADDDAAGSDGEHSSEDSDDVPSKKSNKKRKKGRHERTRMTKQNNKKGAGGSSFFSGLL